MTNTQRYRVNKPDVILENFGDEVVIVNLKNGNYYSLDSLGAEIWARLEQGATLAETLEGLLQKYSGDSAQIEQALTQFVSELQADALMVASEAAGQPVAMPTAPEAKQPFTVPVLHKYTDMQELLLLDPIHEVDETGWPNVFGAPGTQPPQA